MKDDARTDWYTPLSEVQDAELAKFVVGADLELLLYVWAYDGPEKNCFVGFRWHKWEQMRSTDMLQQTDHGYNRRSADLYESAFTFTVSESSWARASESTATLHVKLSHYVVCTNTTSVEVLSASEPEVFILTQQESKQLNLQSQIRIRSVTVDADGLSTQMRSDLFD